MKCYIKKNTPELRKQLKNMGFRLCECAEYEGADWLIADTRERPQIHGWGYNMDEMSGHQAKKILSHDTSYTNCNEDEIKFLSLLKEKMKPSFQSAQDRNNHASNSAYQHKSKALDTKASANNKQAKPMKGVKAGKVDATEKKPRKVIHGGTRCPK